MPGCGSLRCRGRNSKHVYIIAGSSPRLHHEVPTQLPLADGRLVHLWAQAAAVSLPEVAEQPEWVRGGATLLPHQLEALNWLRARWASGTPCAIADDVGLGKTATIISFLQCLRWQLITSAPV